MHWSKKAILPILSLLLIIGCEARKERKRIHKQTQDSLIVDRLFTDLTNWSEESPKKIDSLGKQLSDEFTFYGFNNDYDQDAALFTASSQKQFSVLKEALQRYEFDCRSFKKYEVCTRKLPSGATINCSVRPHPTLEWVFSIKAPY